MNVLHLYIDSVPSSVVWHSILPPNSHVTGVATEGHEDKEQRQRTCGNRAERTCYLDRGAVSTWLDKIMTLLYRNADRRCT